MEKKNLDKLFQKEFEEFEAIPDDKVWSKIEVSLDKKKKKRIVPLWWKLGGAAALLAVLMYVFIPNNTGDKAMEQIISDTNSAQPDTPNNNNSDPTNEKAVAPLSEDAKKDQLVDSSDNISEGTAEKSQENKAKGPLSNKSPKNKLTSTQKKQHKSPNSLQLLSKDPADQVAQAAPKTKKETTAQNTEGDSRISEVPIKESSAVESVAATTEQPKKNDDIVPSTNTVVGAQTEEQEVAQSETQENAKKSIFDAIAEQQQDDSEQTEKESYNRWAMGPSVAPVYFDASGEGSPIHSNFTQNSKSGNLNLSYGLTVAYNVNKKLSVRTGVHRVDFGYDTNEISFSSSLQAPTSEIIDNINYSQNSRNLVVRSNVAGAAQGDVTNNLANQEFSAPANLLNGRMVQQLGYVEVPVELNYALVDKKVGVNIIGGVSSLFLVDNSVSLESEGLVTNLGRANNVNDVNFSTNIGLGVNYKFTQNIQLNVEPVFKYQLNTFSDTAGSFRPYTIGVYSGVQFKF